MILRKNKILLILGAAGFLLVLFLISSSKILTIKSEKNNPENEDLKDQAFLEGNEVKNEYEENLLVLAERLEHYIGEYKNIYMEESRVNELSAVKAKIKELRDEFTSLLVPPDYRREHLDLVLGFQKNDFEKMNEAEYLKTCEEMLFNIKSIKK